MQREFTNIAAHELRTPVQPMLGLSQVLLSEERGKQYSNELLCVINGNAERLQHLIGDILDVTKIESQFLCLKRERFNLNDLILNDRTRMSPHLLRHPTKPQLMRYYLVEDLAIDLWVAIDLNLKPQMRV
jgi:signal transduction histidine kinase